MIPGWLGWLPAWLGWSVFVPVTAASFWAAGHALLFKREPRAALGWVTVCLLFPILGPLSYYLFGINRIRTRARRMRAAEAERIRHRPGVAAPAGLHSREDRLAELLEDRPLPATEAQALVRLTTLVTQRTLLEGNRLDLLQNGEEAYPAMLGAIRDAERSVYLTTYLFESNATGREFVDALAAATARGVQVRVLVDGVGEFYSIPRITRLLRRAGVPVARFLPPQLIPPQVNINLRNHRKILVVDSRFGFTGGMNIGDRHRLESDHPWPVRDVHFGVQGPIVRQLENAFLDDWEFITGESLDPGPEPEPAGDSWARIILDGPGEEVDQLLTVLIGALSVARHRVWIVTPYFVPPRELIEAMKSAALRGVDIRVVVPDENNVPYVDWASRNIQWELLEWGIRIFYQPPPMAHSKLLIVDRDYVQLGSANIDTRSLRLNFELTMEIYDGALADRASDYIRGCLRDARPVSLEELRSRPLWIRLRDATAWLFSPYL